MAGCAGVLEVFRGGATRVRIPAELRPYLQSDAQVQHRFEYRGSGRPITDEGESPARGIGFKAEVAPGLAQQRYLSVEVFLHDMSLKFNTAGAVTSHEHLWFSARHRSLSPRGGLPVQFQGFAPISGQLWKLMDSRGGAGGRSERVLMATLRHVRWAKRDCCASPASLGR